MALDPTPWLVQGLYQAGSRNGPGLSGLLIAEDRLLPSRLLVSSRSLTPSATFELQLDGLEGAVVSRLAIEQIDGERELARNLTELTLDAAFDFVGALGLVLAEAITATKRTEAHRREKAPSLRMQPTEAKHRLVLLVHHYAGAAGVQSVFQISRSQAYRSVEQAQASGIAPRVVDAATASELDHSQIRAACLGLDE